MASRPQHARWATFIVFLACGFGFGAWAAAIAPLKIALGISASELSIALLAVAIGAVVMMQFAGTLVARLGGTGRATRLGAYISCIALALPTLAPSLPFLVASTLLLGAANGLVDVAMNAHAATVERLWGKPIMSSFHAGFSLGGLLGTGFGALTLALGVPTHLLMIPAASVVTILMLAATPYLGRGRVRSASGMVFQLPDRILLPFAMIALCCFLIEGAMADWSGVYLTTLGLTPATAAAGYGAFSLAMVLGRFGGDRIVHAVGREKIIGYGAALAALGLAAAVLFPAFWVIVPGFALVGFGLANVVPVVFSVSARLGKSAAAGIAAVSTMGYGGMLAGPPLIGAVASASSLRVGVTVMAGFALLAVVFALVARRRQIM